MINIYFSIGAFCIGCAYMMATDEGVKPFLIRLMGGVILAFGVALVAIGTNL